MCVLVCVCVCKREQTGLKLQMECVCICVCMYMWEDVYHAVDKDGTLISTNRQSPHTAKEKEYQNKNFNNKNSLDMPKEIRERMGLA